MELLEKVDDQDWQETEKFWISMFRFWGFNLCNHDGGGMSGFKRSAETRRKISIANTGKIRTPEMNQRMREIKLNITQETRDKIGAAGIGRKHKPETITKMKAQRLGHPTSEATRRKIAEAHRGMKHTAETKEKLRQLTKTQPRSLAGAYC